MHMYRRFLVFVATVACLAAFGVTDRPAVAALPILRSGDEGAAVASWQRRLNLWLRATGRAELPVTRFFGNRTLAATRRLEAVSGLRVNGIVSDRTRAALEDAVASKQYRSFEWPVPVPAWFWGWAQWYLHRGPYRDDAPFRVGSSRPETSPTRIPAWAWRRLSDLVDERDLLERARVLVRDRLENRFGAGDIEIRRLLRSERNPHWVRLSGVYGEPIHRIWAFWLDYRERFGRWHIQYHGLDAAAVAPDPASTRELIPCDIRPAFARPRC